jgi:hypothetical protein
VLIDGIFGDRWINGWRGSWIDIPDFTLLHEGTVEVTPTFDLNATLRNLTELDYDLDFILELLRLWYNLGPLGSGSIALFEAEWPVDLFRTTVFDDRFALEGWNSIAGNTFSVHFTAAPNTQTQTCQSVRETYSYYSNLDPFFTPDWGTDPGGLFGLFEPVHNDAWLQMLSHLESAYNECTDETQSFEVTCSSGLASLQSAYAYFPDSIFSGGERLNNTLETAGTECGDITPEPEVIVVEFEIPEEDPPSCADTQTCNDIVIGPSPGGVPTTLVVNQVPEPNILVLFGIGLGLLGFASRKRG